MQLVYIAVYTQSMSTLTVTDFREQCLQVLDNVPAEGIVITKRGKPIATVARIPGSLAEFIGTIPNFAANDEDDLLSTGITWDAESRHPHSD